MLADGYRDFLHYSVSHSTLLVVMRGMWAAEKALHREICAMMVDVRAAERATIQ
jgi:hypothetical protein